MQNLLEFAADVGPEVSHPLVADEHGKRTRAPASVESARQLTPKAKVAEVERFGLAGGLTGQCLGIASEQNPRLIVADHCSEQHQPTFSIRTRRLEC